MNARKLKRILSVVLSLSMALSTNLTSFAAEADVPAGEDAAVADGAAAAVPECEEDAHDWEILETIQEATCSKKGAYRAKCRVCGKEDYLSTSRIGHTYELEGFVEITQADIESGAAPEGAVVNTVITKPATCSEAGEKKYICGTCESGTGHESAPVPIGTLPHTWKEAEDHKDANCTENGYFYTKCANCDAEKDKRDDPAAPKLYHSYEEEAADYDASGITEKIQGDCTQDHEVAYTCSRGGCGHTETRTKKYASHQDGATASEPATCEYPAMDYTPCERPGCTVRRNIQAQEDSVKLYHTYEEGAGNDYDLAGSTTKDEPATCTKDGETIYTCKRPGCTDETSDHHTKTIPHTKTGHDYTSDKSTSEETKPATCQEKGIRTIHCGYAPADKTHDKTEEIPITDHNWTDVPKQEPTCGQDGKEAYTWCPDCQAYQDGEPTVLPADPSKHVYDGEPIVYKPATCTANGVGKYVCTGCGESSIFDTIPAMHEYQMLDKDGEVVVNTEFTGNAETGSTVTGTDAGCLTKGFKTYTCGKCEAGTAGKAYSMTINALGHDYDEGEETTPPTCVEKGVKTFTCERASCTELTKDHSYTEDIDATGEHRYEEGQVIPATCTEPQKVGKACSVCKAADPENLPTVDVDENGEPKVGATGHTYEDEKYQTAEGGMDADAYEADYPAYFSEVEATCANGGVEGRKTFTCANPGCEGEGHTKVVTSPAPKHTLEPKYVNANCQHAGYSYDKCSKCGEETEPIYHEEADPQVGHDYVLQAPAFKNATCTVNGIGQYKCSMCQDIKNEVIPAHHAYEDEKHKVLTGDALQEMVDAKKASTVTKAPATCAASGEATYTCLVCEAGTAGKEKAVVLTKLVHIYDSGEWKSVLDGKQHYGCVDDVRVLTCTQDNCVAEFEGHTKEEFVGAELEHNVANVQETVKPATCTTAKKMVKLCATCSQVAEERDATDADGGAAPALGHTYEDEEYLKEDGSIDEEKYKAAYPDCYSRTEASCQGEGTKGKIVYTCVNAGCEGEGHTYEVELAVPVHIWAPKFEDASCQQNAQSYEECVNCGKKTEKTDMGNMGEEYQQVGHDYQFVEAFRPATCTAAGLGKYQCPMCKDVKNEVTPAHHAYEDEQKKVLTGDALQEMVDAQKVSVTVKTQASCTAAGESEYICLVCEEGTADKKKTVEIPQLQHIYDEADFTWKSVKDGGTHYDCKDDAKIFTCKQTGGCTHTKEEAVAATADHDVSGVTPTVQEATCTLPKRQVKICKVCSGEAERETVTGDEAQPALGHAFQKMENGQPVLDENGDIVLVDDVDTNPGVMAEGDLPTCTQGSERTYTCKRCEASPEVGSQVTVNVPPAGHNKVEKYIPASCEEAGKIIMVCTKDATERFEEEDRVLKDAQGNELDPALGHDREDVPEVKSTCKEKGHTEGVRCKRCTKTLSGITELPLDPENHAWEEDLENSEPADCKTGTPGVNAYYCEHEGVAEPFTKTEPVEAKHAFGPEQISSDGKYIIHTCTVCGYVENLKLMYGFIECTNSECTSFGEIVEATEIPRKASTCTEKGKTKGLACPDCGIVLEGCEDMPMAPHTLSWVTKTPATCGEAGSEVQHCSVCDQDIGQARPIPATGVHTYESKVQDPDCEHAFRLSFICTGCNQEDPDRPTEEIGAPLGHHYVDGVCTNNCGIAPTTAKTSMSAFVDTKNKVRITAITKVNDKNLKVVEMGLLYSTDGVARTEEDFKWYAGAASGWLKKKALVDTTKDGVYMDIGVGSLVTREIYGRAYVVVEDADGNQAITYGELVHGTFEALNK